MSFKHTSNEVLRTIQREDPDGKETEPTEADYASFKGWVLGRFGPDAWNTYRLATWGETDDE